jgi:hypothetical protein
MYGGFSEQYLSATYDEFVKEQQNLQRDMKTDASKDKSKELTLVNSVVMNLLKLINLKKQIRENLNK